MGIVHRGREKKNDPHLVVFRSSVYGRGRKKYKNKRYLSLSGWAMPFLQASRALANVRAVTTGRIPRACEPHSSNA